MSYDAAGNLLETDTQLTNSTDAPVQNAYDALNRLTKSVDANSNVVTTVYDAAGNVVNTIDGTAAKTTYAYTLHLNGLRRLAMRSIDARPSRTRWQMWLPPRLPPGPPIRKISAT